MDDNWKLKTFIQSMYLTVLLCIAASVLVYFIWTFKYRNGKKYNLPPLVSGGYPIIGHFFQMFDNPNLKLEEWKQKYGNVYRIGLAGKTGIVLTNFALLKETYKQDGLSDRLPELSKLSDEYETLFEMNGKRWADHRKVAAGVLRAINQEQIVQTEVTRLLETLDTVDLSEDLNIKSFISTFTNNIGLRLICGKSYDAGHPVSEFVPKFNVAVQELFIFRPFLLSTGLPIWLFTALIPRYRRAEQIMSEMTQLIRNEIKEHKMNLDPEKPNDLIDLSLIEMRKSSDSKRITNEIEILGDAQLMLLGANDTLRSSLEWIALLLADQPKMQEKIYQEIMEVYGSSGPRWDSHSRLPFTEAFIKECQRFKTIFPLISPRIAPVDMKIFDFDVPKGSLIMANLYSVHMDPADYKDPETFNPERFMIDGSHTVPEQWVPFSYGRRNCLGEKMARIVLFSFLTGIVQNYWILPPKAGVSLEESILFLVSAKNPEIRMKKRPKT